MKTIKRHGKFLGPEAGAKTFIKWHAWREFVHYMSVAASRPIREYFYEDM